MVYDSLTSMPNYVDVTGRKYNHLTALRRVPSRRNNQGKSVGARWAARCDCGREVELDLRNLRHFLQKTCGAKECHHYQFLKYQHRLPGDAGLSQAYYSYKGGRRGRRAKWEFTLSKEEAIKLFKSNCWYCGAPPSNKARADSERGKCLYSGIDRVDSKKGYVQGNVRPCCGTCNRMKNAHTEKVFYAHMEKILQHRDERRKKYGRT